MMLTGSLLYGTNIDDAELLTYCKLYCR